MRGKNRALPYVMVRLTHDQKRSIEAATKRDGFQAVAEWARQAMLEKVKSSEQATAQHA